MKLKVYADRMSQPSRAILIFYKVNGIDFEDVKVDLSKHHQLSPQFRAINPLMKVPAVVDGRFKLFESTGRGKTFDMRNDRERTTGCGGGSGSGKDKIDSLSRLLTRILRHMAYELNLNMRSDGYVKVNDLLKLNLKTFANIPLRSHTIDHIREAVRKDNKQRFSLLEENGELLIRANQGHTVKVVETESLLKPILSAEEFPVCVHGTYRKNLESILGSGLKRMKRLHVHFSCGLPTDGEVISGMRQDVNVLIFLDVRKALEESMKLYISDNKVILTEGFDGVVPPKYFERIESWPSRQPISF
ncbi:hypothetical protein GYH30_047870 [Glycine max]|nr:hypothetical protein GYH30_047870 [Glycine max]